MSKVETTSKALLELTTKMNSEGEVRASLSILDIIHKSLHSLERVKVPIGIFYINRYLIVAYYRQRLEITNMNLNMNLFFGYQSE